MALLPGDPGGPPTPEAPGPAGASLLVTKYPKILDTVPNIQDDLTPLSGIFPNFLALMLEAIMAEAGTFPFTGDVLSGELQDLKNYLGVEAANTISNWRSIDKTAEFGGGNEAGQIFGLIKKNHSATVTGYINEQGSSAIQSQGVIPGLREPVAFGEVIGIGIDAADMVLGIGGGIRAGVTGMTTSLISYTYRGHPATASPANPAGDHTQQVNILLAFLTEAP